MGKYPDIQVCLKDQARSRGQNEKERGIGHKVRKTREARSGRPYHRLFKTVYSSEVGSHWNSHGGGVL